MEGRGGGTWIKGLVVSARDTVKMKQYAHLVSFFSISSVAYFITDKDNQ